MRFRHHGAALLAVAALMLFGVPARADNYVVRDGTGATQTFASRLLSGIHYPIHLLYGLFGSTPTPIAVDGSGNLGVNIVGGGIAFSNTTSSPVTISAADSGTSSASGQGGVSLITGSPTANSTAAFATNGLSAGTLTVSGTFVATAQLEASYDGGLSYVAASGLLRGTNLLTAAITAPGAFSVDLASVTNVRLRATAYTSGSAVVRLTYAPTSGMTKLLNGVKLVDSTGADATDTTNHAVKVSVVAGGGSLSAKANAAAQTSSEGATTDPLSMDLARNLRVRDDNLLAAVNGAVPAGANLIGKVGIDQTTDGTTNAVSAHGAQTQGSAVTGGLLRNGCRAATAAPTAVTNGQAVDPMCGKLGKTVVTPYAPDDWSQRGSASTTSTSAQAFTSWSTPGASASFYITGVQCFRTDAGTTMIYATLNDGASTKVPVPAGSGAAPVFQTPLKAASTATAPTFTMSSGVTTAYCSAQGYNE